MKFQATTRNKSRRKGHSPFSNAATPVGSDPIAPNDLAKRDPIAAAVECLEPRTMFSVPNGPFAANAALNGGAVSVHWYSSSNDETGFRIERQTSGGAFTQVGTVAAGQTSFSDTSGAASTAYDYRITAFNGSGNSSSCVTNAVTTPAGTSTGGSTSNTPTPGAPNSYQVPNGPFALSVNATSATSVNLAWYTSSWGNENGFKILRSTNGGAFTQVGTTATGVTSWTDTTVTGGNNYAYSVAAYSLGGDSTYTGGVGVTTPTGGGSSTSTGGSTSGAGANATSVPNGPFAMSTKATSSGITLNWYSSSNNEAGFRVQRSSDGGKTWTVLGTVGAGVTTYTDSSTVSGATYTYAVCAYNNRGDSGFTFASVTASGGGSSSSGSTGSTGSSSSSGTGIAFTPTGGWGSIPNSPFALATKSVTTGSITLQWYNTGNNEGGYLIQRKFGGGSYVNVATTGNGVYSWTDTSVTTGISYTYRVAAFNSGGVSNWTNELTTSPAVTGGVAGSSSSGGTSSAWAKGFFSIGSYLQSLQSMDTWKARGLNTMWNYQLNPSWMQLWEQAAQADGFKVIRNASANPADDIYDPNLLAYLLEDEGDINGVSAAHMQQEYAALKAANPNTPVVINVSGADAINMLDSATPDSLYKGYGQAADIMSNDVYPLSTFGDPSYIDLLTYQSSFAPQYDRGPANAGNAEEVLRTLTNKPEIAIIETSFQNSDSTFAGRRAPTADEFRGEVWDAIIHGARGVCYFPFSFPSNGDGTPPDVVAEMTKQDALMTQMAPIITNFDDPNPQEISGLPKGLEGMSRTYNGHTYYFVFNMSHTPQNLTFNLPNGGTTSAQVVNEGRSAWVQNGSVSDSFGAYGLHIYMV